MGKIGSAKKKEKKLDPIYNTHFTGLNSAMPTYSELPFHPGQPH